MPLRKNHNLKETLHEMVLGVSAAVGDQFFHSLLEHLTRALDVEYAFIAEYTDREAMRVKTVAFRADGQEAEPLEFDLVGTPCERVVLDAYYCTPEGVCTLFPLDHLAMAMGVQGYAGIALTDAAGNVLGPLAVLSRRPLGDSELAETMLRIFAARASAELERTKAEQARREQLHFLQVLIDSIPHPIFYKDADRRYIGCNAALESFIGRTREEIIGKTVFDIGAEGRARICDAVDRKLLATGGVESYDSTMVHTDGSIRDIIFSKTVFGNTDGSIGGIVGTILDITERKRAEEAIQQLAYFDALTGLPNRTLLRDRISQLLSQARREGGGFGVLHLDVDRFKGVNDSLGHACGDVLLSTVAGRIASSVRESDTVARLGSDEFVVILPGVGHEEDVVAVVRKIVEELNRPIVIQGNDIFCTASIGIAIYPTDGSSADALLKNADMAMHKAKEFGGDGYQFYSSELNHRAMERLTLETSLRRALERREFLLHYQPLLGIGSGRIVGVEALLRWDSPELGMVSPARFIPLAEETGLIVPIGEWVLRSACEQLRALHELGYTELRVSVNVSARQFRHDGFCAMVAAVLATVGLDPRYLELELTESVIMERSETAKGILRKLKQMGVSLAIDDFGTGYSSLSYLKHFPIDRLKIDRTFVKEVTVDQDNAAIAEAIVALAHVLNLDVVAEGVETAEQLAFLAALRCDVVQGYHIARPLPPRNLLEFLEARQEDPAARPMLRSLQP
ncbi:putative bifunctional diguanylate cyclase/phosphodiesterase [Geobacter sulfurreducens]|uniref:putative bifunctional diguanylate cyclase/phosphodiesterase n=1 Tax=Geobacter sulfurreducens TaxID=35554 RepID=UPI002C196B32|nr:EAL domain-containing protein [Geobacter sulfurreducens]HML77799.1 EAL domain-containing protein [Geobacter sulfurreducens]